MNSKIFFNKRGQVVVLIAILILGAILALSAGLVTLTIKEMRMGKNIKESVQSIAAADAGMEYILYKGGSGIGANKICPNWTELIAEDGVGYCLELLSGSYVSIGRSGEVRRAIQSPSPAGIDQFAKISDREAHEETTGHDICKCKGAFGGQLEEYSYAQTFLAGRDGDLYRADIFVKAIGDKLETTNLKAVIIGVDGTYTNPFFPSAAKPEPLDVAVPLAETTDFKIVEIGDCESGACKSDISFIFDPSASVTEGERYALVIYEYDESAVNQSPYVLWAACCTERRYLSGKGWFWDGSDWDRKIKGLGFDLEFKTYVLSSPGGEFGEVKP